MTRRLIYPSLPVHRERFRFKLFSGWHPAWHVAQVLGMLAGGLIPFGDWHGGHVSAWSEAAMVITGVSWAALILFMPLVLLTDWEEWDAQRARGGRR